MKRMKWLFVMLTVLVAGSIWLNWPHSQLPVAPPAMNAEQILAATDTQVVSLVITDLRWKLAEIPPEKRTGWRSWPAPARHVLALSWTERDDDPNTPPTFDGFAALLANPAPNMPTMAELAEAYTAIGAPKAAAVVEEADKVAKDADITPGQPIENPAIFAAADRKLRAQSAACKAPLLLRAYVRAHAEDIADARIH